MTGAVPHASQNIWDSGDYPRLARRLEPAARAIADAAGPGRSRAALDVAAGDGSVAGHLHRKGWTTSASDGAAEMVTRGTARLGDAVTWRQADATGQPWPDNSFDLVTSSFGLIFVPDQDAAAAEVARLLPPGGRLLLSVWTHDGYMATMTDVVSSFFAQPPGPGPFRWGVEEFVRATLDPYFATISLTAHSLPWSFDSAHDGRVFFEQASPGHRAAMAGLGDRAPEMMDAVETHLARYAGPDGSVDLAAEYVLVDARRA